MANAAEEKQARADGFRAVELAEPAANAYPKTMEHPALSAAHSVMYGGQMAGRNLQVNNAAEEKQAIAEGFERATAIDGAPPAPAYPKTLVHPGFSNGGATGLLVKDYRGKNAEQEIWRFDAGLVGKICEALKQAANRGRAMDREARGAGDAHDRVHSGKGEFRMADGTGELEAETSGGRRG